MRILFVIDQPLVSPRDAIAGLQVRTLELAQALSTIGHDVTIAQTSDPTHADPLLPITITSVEALVRLPRFDAAIAVAPTLNRVRTRVRAARWILDGYEAPFGSFLSHAASLYADRPAIVDAWYQSTVSEYLAALAIADGVICANPNQRLCYQTLLCTIGAVTPGDVRPNDVMVVHSGVSPSPPAAGDDRFDGIARKGPVVLWVGPVYPWFDLQAYVGAIPAIAEAVPATQFVFVGLAGVDGASRRWTEATVRETLATSSLNRRLHFMPWLPYDARGVMYGTAAVAVCAYHAGLETTLSMRTRLLDMVWGRVPIVTTGGDWLSEFLRSHAAALIVRPNDRSALATAVIELLTDRAKAEAMRGASRRLGENELSWKTQIASLDSFLSRAIGASDGPRPKPNGAVRIRRSRWMSAAAMLVARARTKTSTLWRSS